jgi:NhaP-type Na+/H+ and K+/H+ antiporter
VARERLPRLDSLFRESADVARRLGLAFGELPIRGETQVGEVAQFYDLDFGDADPSLAVADWAAARLRGHPELDATIPVPGAKLVVRRLESGRIASLGLQLDELFKLEPDEQLLDRIVAEVDETTRIRRWFSRLKWRRRGA